MTTPAQDPVVPQEATNAAIYINLIFFIGQGIGYAFFGAKVMPVLHGIACGFMGFVFFGAIAGAIGGQALALIVGLAVAGACGYWCFTLTKFQAFLLGCQFGGALGSITYGLLFSWWITSPYFQLVYVLAWAGVFAYLACTKPQAMIVECTAVIGSFYLNTGLLIAFASTYASAGSLAILIFVAGFVGIAFAGRFTQRHLGFHLKQGDIENEDAKYVQAV